MLYTLLRRVFKEHSGAHLWVPLLIVAILSAVSKISGILIVDNQIAWHNVLDWQLFWAPWLQASFDELLHSGRELLAIYLAFAWIMWKSVRKASDIRWTMIGDLSDCLAGADRYFAIGTIPLREWFEPNSLVYLATIIQCQISRGAAPLAAVAGGTARPQYIPFRHERVLLFFDENDFEALQASYLDQHYARSFSALHDRFDISLAYMRPKEAREIFQTLSPVTRWNLTRYRWYARPTSLWRREWLQRFAKSPSDPQPFAVIYSGPSQTFVRFSKNGNSLTVEKILDAAEIEACRAFVHCIEATIYRPAGAGLPATELFERYKFNKYLCP